VNQSHSVHYILYRQCVLLFLHTYLLRQDSCLVLYEIQSFDHVVYCDFWMDSYRQHPNHSALKRVEQTECWSISFLHVELNRLQSAHVEEGFVLDGRQSWMVEIVAENEASGLQNNVLVGVQTVDWCWMLVCGIWVLNRSNIIVFSENLDVILTSFLIYVSLHKDIEKWANRRVVC
jgi:hypothetical protein